MSIEEEEVEGFDDQLPTFVINRISNKGGVEIQFSEKFFIIDDMNLIN